MSYVVVVVVVRTCKCINTICSIFFFLEMLVQGVQGKTFCWESIYGIWSDSKKKNRLTESSQLSKRSSMEMHCKVCSPIWNTKNLIYKKKLKKTRHFIPFPLISAIYVKTSPRCLHTSSWRFSEGRKMPASDMYSSVLLLYSFICEGESNYNVNYSLEQRNYLSSPKTKKRSRQAVWLLLRYNSIAQKLR